MAHPANAAEIAARHLRETGNPAIGWGDSMLLHEVADRPGLSHESPATERKVLDLIDRSHRGVLEKRYHSFPQRGLRRCRQFWLPEAL